MTTHEALRPTEVSHQTELEQTIGRYEQSDQFLDFEENTRFAYATDLDQFQKYCRIQDISEVNKIELEDVLNWRDQLRQAGKTTATINRKLASLLTFFNWVQAEGIVRPDFTIGFPKPEPREKRQREILSDEQVHLLISKARNLRDASLILIALATGATIKEILNLNAGDILRNVDKDIAIGFKGGVRRTQPRIIIVDKEAGGKIIEYIKDSKLESEDPLILGFLGFGKLRGRLTRGGANQIFKRYGQEIGAENLNSRMLQYTFIANFAGTPRELAEILGRKS